ncbi:hypothetical protein EMWEY_00049310 [Eimeria maxima]|uniref:Uncharacterized protein n=1 Tax=Eimeria maxima TaxID=5804 RepID=U6M219_EIMMA|nr:hypothetical protein EMWEY_00049310 [Eimeria maxima]CDJ58282.1 hypothetical protein EMWEY_00049310 [Eimeria maxima]
MKNLLEKAKDDEADAELHQYESDDDDEEGGEEKGQDGQTGGGLGASGALPSDPRGAAAVARGQQGGPLQQDAAAGSSTQQLKDTQETLEAKVVRVMQQHMGRMADFMSAFKVKEKNDDFRRIQAVVHKVCKMEATEDKQKFIILKPEFRL